MTTPTDSLDARIAEARKDLAERSRAALLARNTEVFELQQQLTKANAELAILRKQLGEATVALVTARDEARKAARADALEEAAVECERHIPWWTHESGGSSARLCAQFIRSLVKEPR